MDPYPPSDGAARLLRAQLADFASRPYAEHRTRTERVAATFELLDGPSPGTKLVANPPADLQDGQKIKEKERDDG